MDFYLLNNERVIGEHELLPVGKEIRSLYKLEMANIDLNGKEPVVFFLREEDQSAVMIFQLRNNIWETVFATETVEIEKFFISKIEILTITGHQFQPLTETEKDVLLEIFRVYTNNPIDDNFFYLLGYPKLSLFLDERNLDFIDMKKLLLIRHFYPFIEEYILEKIKMESPCDLPEKYIFWVYQQYLNHGWKKTITKIAGKGYLEVIKCLKNSLSRKFFSNKAAIEAARKGHLETLRYLSGIGVKPNCWGAIYAAENGHLETLKFLVSIGVMLTVEVANLAARNGHLEVIQYLLTLGFEPDSNGVEWAARNGHLEVVEYLLMKGIEVTVEAANRAAENGKLEMVKFLISRGVSPDVNGVNFAILRNHVEMVKYLCSLGITPDAWAMNWTERDGQTEIMEYLQEIGIYPPTK
jgi:hypothetical protein